ncbi:MAG: phenylacetic acid degradation operon negative regulatory protein PaaX [Burkholderiaceae bacterium]|nr:phenylacetic acid degradation operon negative regulatory protein PaaX [Burkholderiaceae bacterium]
MQAGSLIITVFGDVVMPRGGSIWLGSLIQLLAPLDINERLIRTTVSRLADDQWLDSQAHGRRANYALTPAGLRRFEEASRHIYAAHAPLWDRRWRLILAVGEMDTRERDRVRKALFWQGFGMVSPGCYVHPSADLTAAFDALMVEGLADSLKKLMPMVAAESRFGPSATDNDMISRAWNLDGLARAYIAFCKQYQPILEFLRTNIRAATNGADALLLRILLIHDYRRLLLRDPELPAVLAPRDWPGQRARLLCRELYLRLLAPSEAYLDEAMQLADRSVPQALPMLSKRFQADDVLTESA